MRNLAEADVEAERTSRELAQVAIRRAGPSRHLPPRGASLRGTDARARADGSFPALFKSLAQVDVLVIEDGGSRRRRMPSDET